MDSVLSARVDRKVSYKPETAVHLDAAITRIHTYARIVPRSLLYIVSYVKIYKEMGRGMIPP